ncbi:MAG: dTMP kinase [Propionibacteriaceae bacterium]|jgi:dTMP kinase|nr:dTMP kinase [Propionibacteriaceae bacterium]
MTRGHFLVFEGGDGAGKTTQTTILAEWLARTGREVVVTQEPGGTALGTALRGLLLDPDGAVAPAAEALLYAADKAQHVKEVIEPAIAAGKIVVCDRYVESMIAYQGARSVLDLADVERIATWAVGGLTPDLTILLDVPVAEAFAGKGELDRMEAAGTLFHERVRDHFLALADRDPQRHLVVARQSIEETAQVIHDAVESILA